MVNSYPKQKYIYIQMVKCVTFAGKLDFRWELCSCLSPHYIKERFFSLCIADQSPFIISVIMAG